jgi:hypothetical protein
MANPSLSWRCARRAGFAAIIALMPRAETPVITSNAGTSTSSSLASRIG